MVHDAVRPFVELAMIQQIVDAARKDGAVILGIPSVDTVKKVERQTITGTIPRERIVLAQTPAGLSLHNPAQGLRPRALRRLFRHR